MISSSQGIRGFLTRMSGPSEEALTMDRLVEHLRISPDERELQENTLESIRKAVREMAEEYMKRAIGVQAWRLILEGFPEDDDDVVEIPRPPLVSVTKIEYLEDLDSGYVVWGSSEWQVLEDDAVPAVVVPSPGMSYPSAIDHRAAVRVDFNAGYAIHDIPSPIIEGMLLAAGTRYMNRDEVVISNVATTEIPQNAKWLWDPYRIDYL